MVATSQGKALKTRKFRLMHADFVTRQQLPTANIFSISSVNYSRRPSLYRQLIYEHLSVELSAKAKSATPLRRGAGPEMHLTYMHDKKQGIVTVPLVCASL
jgi:hypothetical protein